MEVKCQKVSKPKGPSNLFQRILMQTRKSSISKRSIDEAKEGSVSTKGSLPLHVNGGASLNDEGVEQGYTEELINLVLNGKGNVHEKVRTLKALTEYCSENTEILEVVVSPKVISFCEQLLITYCDRSSKPTEELRLLVPFLSLFQTYTTSVDTTVFEAFLVRQSDFMYQLMRSCVMCVDALLSKSEELMKLTWKKKLAGRVRKLAKEDSIMKLTRLHGIPYSVTHEEHNVPEDIVPVESYQVTLFDTTSAVNEKNINQHILNLELPKLSDPSLDLHCASGLGNGLQCKKDQEMEEWAWNDVVVANVLPFGELLAYTKGDWNHWLILINGELVEFLRSVKRKDGENAQDLEIKIGSIVGFWSSEVKFKWKPPMKMQCFRGIVLGKAVGSFEGETDVTLAIWAIDIGTLVFGKNVWLLGQDFSSIPPLVSLCSLDMKEGGGEGESVFLLVALKVLAKLLATNPAAGRHMVAFGSRKFVIACDTCDEDRKTCDGGVFLKLIVYPDIEVRVEFLKLMILLARSSSEILHYFIECKFYLAVYSRLEIYVHFCNVLPSDNPLWSEVRQLVIMLSTMAEGTEMNMTVLPGWNHIQQVLVLLTEIDTHAYVKYLAAKCLATFESHKITRSRSDQALAQGLLDGRPSQNCAVHRAKGDVAAARKEAQRPSRGGGDKRIPTNSHKDPAHYNLMESENQGPVLSVLDVGDNSSSDEESSSLTPVDALADMARQMDRYTKGYRVNISNDLTHELSQEKFSNQISENSLAQTICGFLNNGVGGSVYFGINSKGIIEGMKMARAQRDNFRKGVDRMMTRSISPEVRPACYDVIYVPVFGPGEVAKGFASHGNWVIEVHVKALPHVIYTVSSNRKCYVRKGSNCVESMSICLRQEAAEQNKKEILQAIEEVKAKIPQNKDKLLMFVKDYLDRSKNLV